MLIRTEGAPTNIDLTALTKRAEELLSITGRGDGELSILLADDDTIARLNRDYLGRSGPTNVLSFASGVNPPIGLDILGDIAISYDTAARQAVDRGVSLLDEVTILLVHGLLHLLGHIHDIREGASDEDRMLMESEESRLLDLFGISL
ncbi:MAG: rRNA maturation RNase YbeY [Deltaproteobacteria bacterium]|nr:rRNA maturation RNase YbeY [Candidatus Zymogenaceae bacterium]